MISIRDLPAPATAQDTVRDLLTSGSPPYATLYLPLQRNWNELQHDRTLLRSLTDKAHEALRDRGLSSEQADALLAPALDLNRTTNGQFADADGLALFLASDFHTAMALPVAPEAAAHVDERFHVRPLWRMLAVDGTFFILALAKGGVQLFRASRYSVETVSLPDVPTSLEESTQFDEPTTSLGYHTGTADVGGGPSGRRAARYYGQEDAGDRTYVKEQILQFFQKLDNGVQKVLRQYSPLPPLVLAGIPYLQGLYRKVNQYAPLMEDGIEGEAIGGSSSRDWDGDALQAAGWPVAEAHFDEERQSALKRYEQVNGAEPSRAAATLSTVVPAAVQGRIDTLFVPLHAQTWGQFDSSRHAMTIRNDESAQPEDTELYNLATASTLLNSGTVYISDAKEPSANMSEIRATLRY
jgi:uncharacterized protein YjiS (DUF1127 family)